MRTHLPLSSQLVGDCNSEKEEDFISEKYSINVSDIITAMKIDVPLIFKGLEIRFFPQSLYWIMWSHVNPQLSTKPKTVVNWEISFVVVDLSYWRSEGSNGGKQLEFSNPWNKIRMVVGLFLSVSQKHFLFLSFSFPTDRLILDKAPSSLHSSVYIFHSRQRNRGGATVNPISPNHTHTVHIQQSVELWIFDLNLTSHWRLFSREGWQSKRLKHSEKNL